MSEFFVRVVCRINSGGLVAKKHKEISVSELRADLPMILHRIVLLNESYVVKKHGKKVCIIQAVPGNSSVNHPHGGAEWYR